jgi:hypothetical protein
MPSSVAAHCHFGLGKFYQQMNKREHLTTATTIYRKIGAQSWLEQAESSAKQGWRPISS